MTMSTNEYLWKIRCPESGYIVAECGCLYCFDEFEMDSAFDEYAYLDEDLEDPDIEEDPDPFWELEYEEIEEENNE